MMLKKTFSLLLILVIALPVLAANEPGFKKPLKRQLLDFGSLKAGDYTEGRFRIKFTQEFMEQIEVQGFQSNEKGVLTTGIDHLDVLLDKYHVTEADKAFNSPGNRNGGHAWQSERHQSFGLNRWYTFSTGNNVSMSYLLNEYQKLDIVEIAEPILAKELSRMPDNAKDIIIPNDPEFSKQWHLHNTGQTGGTPGADINILPAWEIQTGSPDVIVSIVDTGVKANHEDLAGNIWPGIGYNFYDMSSFPLIAGNHGTHVAGIVAARSNNYIGVSGIAGGNADSPGVQLMNCQVFHNWTEQAGENFHLALIYAADNGAAIAQNSWNYALEDYYEQILLDAIDYFVEFGGGNVMDGGLVVFSAGNTGWNECVYPACYENAFSVAASLHNDSVTLYSTRHSTVDITAPGGHYEMFYMIEEQSIYSTVIKMEGTYGYMSGTSMAAPMVSGVAALILSEHPGVFSQAEVASIIRETAESENFYAINSVNYGLLGSGRLDAHAALLRAGELAAGNPSDIAIEPLSIMELKLQWQPGSMSDNVLLAQISQDSYPVPVPGQAYQSGETIDGTASTRVLYSGPATQFIHEGLEVNNSYLYRLWSYDEEYQYSAGINAIGVTVPPPSILTASVSGSEVHLEWSPPDAWIYWDRSSGPVFSFGRNEPSSLRVAQRFDPNHLHDMQVSGKQLSRVGFMANDQDASFTINVWHGNFESGPTGEPALEINVGTTQTDVWTLVHLDEPITLIPGQTLWIGLDVDHSSGFPVAVDSGPAFKGYGDLLYWDFGQGPAWYSMRNRLGINRNFLIRGFVEMTADKSMDSPGGKNTSMLSVNGKSEIIPRNEQTPPYSTLLVNYQVYRNDELVTTLNYDITTYIDQNPGSGQFEYEVKAIYINPSVMSGPSNKEVVNLP